MRRSLSLTFGVSRQEFDDIDRLAQARGMSMGEYVRWALQAAVDRHPDHLWVAGDAEGDVIPDTGKVGGWDVEVVTDVEP